MFKEIENEILASFSKEKNQVRDHIIKEMIYNLKRCLYREDKKKLQDKKIFLFSFLEKKYFSSYENLKQSLFYSDIVEKLKRIIDKKKVESLKIDIEKDELFIIFSLKKETEQVDLFKDFTRF